MRIAHIGSASRSNIFKREFQNRHSLSSVSSATPLSEEIAMTSFGTRPLVSRLILATASMAASKLWAHAAFASQGPGGGQGTASSFTQLAMAIFVYGASALVIGTGLIGAMRR
jgi:hypothetical protein